MKTRSGRTLTHRISGAAVALWLLAPLAILPDFDRDSIRLPMLLFLAVLFVGIPVLRGLQRRELLLRKEPVLVIGALGWAAAAISFIVHQVPSAGVPVLGFGLAGLCVYGTVSKGLLGREAVTRAGFWTLAIVCLLLSGYVLLQSWQIDPVGWGVQVTPAATLGNSSEAGSFLAIVAVVVLLSAPAQRGILLRFGAFGIGLIAVAAVVATGSRTGMIALVGALAVVGIQLIPMRPLRALAFAGAMAGAVLAWPWFSGVTSFQVRLGIWRGVRELSSEHPWLGVGPGGFRAHFVPYRDPEEYRLSHAANPELYREVDHAHNIYLHALAERGWPGAVLLLMLLYAILRRWMFFMDHQAEARNRWWVAGAGAGVIAFAIAGLAQPVTTSAAHAALFWYLAAANELLGNRRPMARPVSFGGLMAAVPGAALLLLFFCIGLVFRSAVATHAFYRSRRAETAEAQRVVLEEAREWNYRDWRVRYRLGVQYQQMQRVHDAVAEFNAALAEHPNHVPSLIQRGAVYSSIPNSYQKSEASFEEAEALAPRYYLVAYARGSDRLRHRKFIEAEEFFRTSLERLPGHGMSHLGLGVSLLATGRRSEAEREFQSARAAGVKVEELLRMLESEIRVPGLREYLNR